MSCTHPAQLRGADGVMRCLTCKAAIEPPRPKKPKEPNKPDKGGGKTEE